MQAQEKRCSTLFIPLWHLEQDPSLIVNLIALLPVKKPCWIVLHTMILVRLKEQLPHTHFHILIHPLGSGSACHLLLHLSNSTRGVCIIASHCELVRFHLGLCPIPTSQNHARLSWIAIVFGRPSLETTTMRWLR